MACNFCDNPRGEEYPAGEKKLVMCEKCLHGKFPDMNNEQFRAWLVKQSLVNDREKERKREATKARHSLVMSDADERSLYEWQNEVTP